MTGFKTDISKQGTKFELVFTTDNKDYFKKVQSVARDCIDHKPITQFDRIKAMSVEELARVIDKYDLGISSKICFEKCEKMTGDKYHCSYPEEERESKCIDCVKEWLESEVQGE